MQTSTYNNVESGNTFYCSVIDVTGQGAVRAGHVAIRNVKTGSVSVGRMFHRTHAMALEVGSQYRDRLNTEQKFTCVQVIAVLSETDRMAFVPIIGEGTLEVIASDRWPDDIRQAVDRRIKEHADRDKERED
jgi:hypothetical protein